jgi:3-oxoacyl-[acyl-carrier-protein] synthase III
MAGTWFAQGLLDLSIREARRIQDTPALVLAINDAVTVTDGRRVLKVPSKKVYVNLDRYGNTSSASIPIALDEVVRLGMLRERDLLVLVAFGAGLTWGATVVRW